MKKYLHLICFCGILFLQCDTTKKRTINPNDVKFSVEYDRNFDHTIYPSLIIGLSNQSPKRTKDFFTFKLISPVNKALLRIKTEATVLNYETLFQTQLETKGTEYIFSPIIKWNYEKLKTLSQQGTVDFTFRCYLNDEEVDIVNLRLNYRSINECLLGIIDTANKYVDYKWMFAAYVNEENPAIDNLLKEMLKNNIVDRFVGYQGTEEEVKKQVFSFWYFLQSKGVKYSSIADIGRKSKKVVSQYIRFFDQVYFTQQANCVDGCVFFASVLTRIGIYPFFVGEPKHMYLGFYKNKGKKGTWLLETTLIGEVDLSELEESAQQKADIGKYKSFITPQLYQSYEEGTATLNEVKKAISLYSFNRALNYNVKRYNQNLSNINNPKNVEYQFYDIAELRKQVQPIGR